MFRVTPALAVATAVSAVFLAGVAAADSSFACPRLSDRLVHCPGSGWTQTATVEGATASFVRGDTFDSTVKLREGLSEDDLAWVRFTDGHAPISARGEVLAVFVSRIGSRTGSSVLYTVPHAKGVAAVAMTTFYGEDFALSVTTRHKGGAADPDALNEAHAAFLATLTFDEEP
jgi:hypothetical protein